MRIVLGMDLHHFINYYTNMSKERTVKTVLKWRISESNR